AESSARGRRHDVVPAGLRQVARREVGGPELEEPKVLTAAASLDAGGRWGARGDLGAARVEAAAWRDQRRVGWFSRQDRSVDPFRLGDDIEQRLGVGMQGAGPDAL